MPAQSTGLKITLWFQFLSRFKSGDCAHNPSRREIMTEVSLVEGMKGLAVLEKRMAKNIEQVRNYACILSSERPAFGSEDEQKKEIGKLLQSNEDLMKEIITLKERIERTNLDTKVQFDGVEYSISALLLIKRKVAKIMLDTYSALNDKQANGRMSMSSRMGSAPDGKPVHIVRLYDERKKNDMLAKWQAMYDNISSRLEVINATTKLL